MRRICRNCGFEFPIQYGDMINRCRSVIVPTPTKVPMAAEFWRSRPGKPKREVRYLGNGRLEYDVDY